MSSVKFSPWKSFWNQACLSAVEVSLNLRSRSVRKRWTTGLGSNEATTRHVRIDVLAYGLALKTASWICFNHVIGRNKSFTICRVRFGGQNSCQHFNDIFEAFFVYVFLANHSQETRWGLSASRNITVSKILILICNITQIKSPWEAISYCMGRNLLFCAAMNIP